MLQLRLVVNVNALTKVRLAGLFDCFVFLNAPYILVWLVCKKNEMKIDQLMTVSLINQSDRQ